MLRLVLIIIGGGVGSVFRYLVSGLAYKHLDNAFPWGTLAVNLIGSFLVGFLWEIFNRFTFSPNTKMFVFIGVIGGFTTFSSYALESVNLIREGEIGLSLTNMIISNILGVFLVLIGLVSCRYLLTVLK